jgi:hypothetical protein
MRTKLEHFATFVNRADTRCCPAFALDGYSIEPVAILASRRAEHTPTPVVPAQAGIHWPRGASMRWMYARACQWVAGTTVEDGAPPRDS